MAGRYSPMQELDMDSRGETSLGAPGKLRPAVFALETPKASAPRLHQRNAGWEFAYWLPAQNAGSNTRGSAPSIHDSKRSPLDGGAARGLTADFFGASPVASALGVYARRDPGVTRLTYHGWFR